eukprot:14001157-Heterocapsa_arctica.AAC.1
MFVAQGFEQEASSKGRHSGGPTGAREQVYMTSVFLRLRIGLSSSGFVQNDEAFCEEFNWSNNNL